MNSAMPNEHHGREKPSGLWTDGNTCYKVESVTRDKVYLKCCIRGLPYHYGLGEFLEDFRKFTDMDIDEMMELV